METKLKNIQSQNQIKQAIIENLDSLKVQLAKNKQETLLKIKLYIYKELKSENE